MPKKAKAGQMNQKKPTPGPFGTILIAGGAGFGVTLLLLAACSWMFTRVQLPAWAAVPLATCAVCAGCFVSGYLIAHAFGKNGLFCGLCAGCAFFVLYLSAAFLNGQYSFSTLAGIKLVCYILSGCFGGCVGVIFADKTRRRRAI